MNIPNTTMLAMKELEPLARAETGLEAQLRATMKAARGHWLVTDEEQQFKAAVGAVMLCSDEETKARIIREMQLLGGVSAAIAGVPVDFGALFGEDDLTGVIGLLRLWRETK